MKRANFNDLWYNPVAEADRPHVQQAAQARQVHRRDVQPLGAQDRNDTVLRLDRDFLGATLRWPPKTLIIKRILRPS